MAQAVSYHAIGLTTSQITGLQLYADSSQYPDGYTYLQNIVESQPDYNIDTGLQNLSNWLGKAADINGDPNSIYGSFVRGATEGLGDYLNDPIDDTTFQNASNDLARSVFNNVIAGQAIKVQDVPFPSEAISSEVSLRAAITKGCRQRCAYLTHQRTVSAPECYLNRIARDMGTELTAERYRRLAPQSCSALAGKGRKFAINTKRRTNEAREQVNYSAAEASNPMSQTLQGCRDTRSIIPFGTPFVCQQPHRAWAPHQNGAAAFRPCGTGARSALSGRVR